MTAGIGVVSPLPPSGQKPPPVKLDDVLKKLLKNADKDGDGQLDQTEFAAVAGALTALMPVKPGEVSSPSEMFTKADVNHDGKVSLDELKGFVVDQIQKGQAALNKLGTAMKNGEASVFTSPDGMTLSPEMQLQVMQTNLSQSMMLRPDAAAYAKDAYGGSAKGYSAGAYFKADGNTLI